MAATEIKAMSRHKFCVLLINTTRFSNFRITLTNTVTKK